MDKLYLTPEEYRKLTEELEYLYTTGRDEAAERIRIARCFGELAENSEYAKAMKEQAKMEERIAKIEQDRDNAIIVETAEEKAAMQGKIIMTTEERKKLTEELKYLYTTGRDEAAERIAVARSFGDLTENSEYNEAMNEQARMEARIAKIEQDLDKAMIISGMDPGVFKWAKSYASNLPSIDKRRITNLRSYFERVGIHISLYHDDETGETLQCIFYENEDKLYWREITNYNEMMKENAEMVNLFLRNGEYLCTHISKGKDLKVVDMSYI